MSEFIKVVEVGPRDGLQNEKETITTNTKIEFINKLSETGLKTIEAGSFVSPKWIPQLADTALVYKEINKQNKISYPVLVPNEKGMEQAIACDVKEIAVFSAASDEFTKKNTNCTIKESLDRIAAVIDIAHKHKIKVRAYVSTAIACPYAGNIKPDDVARVADKLIALGCYEISIGDTIGVGTPNKVKKLLRTLMQSIPSKRIAVHFHDTYGMAIANIYAALEYGITTVDSSIAGLGGCPYAKGASGNVATEDVIYLLEQEGFKTGVDLEKLIKVSDYICKILNRSNNSKVALSQLN